MTVFGDLERLCTDGGESSGDSGIAQAFANSWQTLLFRDATPCMIPIVCNAADGADWN